MNTEWKPIAASLYDLIFTGDLEALLWQLKGVREAEEVRMALYNARKAILDTEEYSDCTPAPTSHPIPTGATGEDEQRLSLGVVLGLGEYIIQTTASGEAAQIVFSQASDHDRATRTIGDLKIGGHGPFDHSRIRGQIMFTSAAGLDALEVQLRELRKEHWPETVAVAAAPAAGDALDSQAIAALRLALKYWEDRQQRYKNRSPAWVEAARAAIAQQSQRKEA